ncbi:hypothetical protein ACOBQX_07395 [Actinokineospora sp. G85]|uniref:hypothetical protein n=1 Tax=Actinokineospora sp. G85 TaxID=3406626 RepID=UPI003C77CE65
MSVDRSFAPPETIVFSGDLEAGDGRPSPFPRRVPGASLKVVPAQREQSAPAWPGKVWWGSNSWTPEQAHAVPEAPPADSDDWVHAACGVPVDMVGGERPAGLGLCPVCAVHLVSALYPQGPAWPRQVRR